MSNDPLLDQQGSNQQDLLTETKEERYDRFTKQLYHAGAKGMLRGTLIALVTGYALSFRYNHGPNKVYFRNVYKAWWFVCWNIVGITFTTDIAKMNISRQAAIEDEIKRNQYWIQEINKK